MLALLMFGVTSFAQLMLYGQEDSCAHIDSDVLHDATRDTRRPIVVFFTNTSQMSSQLFTTARHMSAELAPHVDSVAYVVADCTNYLVGLDFSDERVGMDCGVTYIHNLMQSVDAYGSHDVFSIKLGHVLAHLDTWHERLDCFVWGNDMVRAWFFWIVIAAFVRYCCCH